MPSLLSLLLLPLTTAYVLFPGYPQVHHQVPLQPLPLLYLLPQTPIVPLAKSEGLKSTFDTKQEFSALPSSGRANFLNNIPFITKVAPTRNGPRNVDLCYFLGQDVFTSHVRCNPNWADGTNEGVRRYINEMTYETNRMIGTNNLRLVWKGPFVRTEAAPEQQDQALINDVYSVVKEGCDAVVFLLFNEFSEDCQTTTTGHEYGGVNYGGICDVPNGQGYTVVVDQGFANDAWTGPQILAHHLLLMLTSDLPDAKKTCPNRDSLLYEFIDFGKQRVDQCVVDKLNRSRVSLRPCMQD